MNEFCNKAILAILFAKKWTSNTFQFCCSLWRSVSVFKGIWEYVPSYEVTVIFTENIRHLRTLLEPDKPLENILEFLSWQLLLFPYVAAAQCNG